MPNIQTKIGERRAKRKREIDRDITLNDYIEKINNREILDYETVEIEVKKLGKNTEIENLLKVELEHANFQIRQLKKNGHLTHFGKFDKILLYYF